MVVGYTVSQKEKAQHKCQEMHQKLFLDLLSGGEEEKLPGFVTESRRCYGPM
ncbi:hypothetical protein YC2023_112643 [Brassica napus]